MHLDCRLGHLGFQLTTLIMVCYMIYNTLPLYYKLSSHVLECVSFSSGTFHAASPVPSPPRAWPIPVHPTQPGFCW